MLLSPGHPLYARDDRGDARATARRRRRRRAVRRTLGDRAVRDPLLHLRGPRAGPARAARAGMGRAGRRGRGRRTARSSSPPTCCTTSPRSTSCREGSRRRTPRRCAARPTTCARWYRTPSAARSARSAPSRLGCARTICAKRWTPQREALQQRWRALEERVYRGEDAARFARDEAERRARGPRTPARGQARRFRRARRGAPGRGKSRRDRARRSAGAARGTRGHARDARGRHRSSSRRWQRPMRYEREQGREWRGRVSHFRDGRGFDVRSWTEPPDGRVTDVRRIEVKGRVRRQRRRVAVPHGVDRRASSPRSFWLYVVYQRRLRRTSGSCASRTQPPRSAARSRSASRSRPSVVPGDAIEAVA